MRASHGATELGQYQFVRQQHAAATPAFIPARGSGSRSPVKSDAALGFCRGWYHVTEDTAKGRHLRELLIEHFGTSDDHVVLPLMVGRDISVISWAPPTA